MDLLVGADNFIGQAVLRQLRKAEYPVRILLEPSPDSPYLPIGKPTEVSVAALTDARSVRSALVGIDRVIHLGSGYSYTDAEAIRLEAERTAVLSEAAVSAGIERFLYLSYLGADRLSAYPSLRAKAQGEEFIRSSGVPHTIIRSALIYGAGDSFTTILASILRKVPFIFPLPGNPETLVQPLWVEELAVAVQWGLEDEAMVDRTIEIGGPEFLSLREIVDMIQILLRRQRMIVSLAPPLLKFITPLFSPWLLGQAGGEFWIDYFAVNRTTALDSMPRMLGIQPSQMGNCIDYLKGK